MTTTQDEKTTAPTGVKTNGAASALPPPVPESTEVAVEAPTPVSSYIKLSEGSRTKADAVATVSRSGNKLYLKDRYGQILIWLEYEYEEDAMAEMECVNEQLDQFEAARNARPATRTSRFSKRSARRR